MRLNSFQSPRNNSTLLALAFSRHTQCRCRCRCRCRCGFDGEGGNTTACITQDSTDHPVSTARPSVKHGRLYHAVPAQLVILVGAERAEISISTTAQVMSRMEMLPLCTSQLRRRGRVDSKHRGYLMLDAIIRTRPPCQSKLDGQLVLTTRARGLSRMPSTDIDHALESTEGRDS